MDALVRLRFLAPSSEPPDGQAAITADLSGFALLAGRVGRDAALLYLLLRAVRVRAARGQATIRSLAWPLRARDAAVRAWLDRLARADLLGYAVERTEAGEVLAFEFLPQTPLRAPDRLWPPSATRTHALPTIWFMQALPLLGRDAFALYLALLGHEPVRASAADVRLAAVAQTIGITAAWRQHRAVRRLVRAGVLTLDGARGTVREPPPPTPRERRLLRFLAIPFLPAALRELAALGLALALAVATLFTLALHAARHH
jgi:hypothetical protein